MFSVQLFTSLAVLGCHFLGIQADLEIFYEDVVIDTIDPEYIKDAEAYVNTESTNDDSVYVNFTIIKPLPTTAQGHLELVGASMGEYELPTPYLFDMGLCDLIDEPVLIGPFLKSIGFDPDECPPKNGVYAVAEYRPPMGEIPQDLEPNKYKVIFDMTDAGKTILQASFFVEIQ